MEPSQALFWVRHHDNTESTTVMFQTEIPDNPFAALPLIFSRGVRIRVGDIRGLEISM